MIRLVLLLCAGLYFGLLVLGEDHGQKRYGLMLADQQPEPTAKAQPVEAATEVVFIPAQTVMKPVEVAATPETAVPEIVVAAPAVEAAPAPEVTLTSADTSTALPEPEIQGGKLFTVASRQVNVRQGPGTDTAIVGSLNKGEQVLVVLDDNPVEGWSRVQLEGDGVEGYIATRLLVE